MRYGLSLVLLIILAVVLAACGGNDAPVDTTDPTQPANVAPATAVPDAPDSPTTVPDSPDSPTAVPGAPDTPGDSEPITMPQAEVTESVLEMLDITPPPVGVIVPPSTEELFVFTNFDYIRFEQKGGMENISIVVEIYSDGQVFLDGNLVAFLTPGQITEINNVLIDMNFLSINGQFTVPGGGADIYEYDLTVESVVGSNMVSAMDGYTPQELLQLFAKIRSYAEQ